MSEPSGSQPPVGGFRSQLPALADLRARAQRVIGGNQSGSYKKLDMAHDILALIELAEERMRTIEWWANDYVRQVSRVREAYTELGIENPVNYTGEVRNFRADTAEAALYALSSGDATRPTGDKA